MTQGRRDGDRWPASSPAMLRSSSTCGQRIPSPSPRSSHCARCTGVASARRGYHASGTAIRRPSRSETTISSTVTSTSLARGPSTVEELIPSLLEASAIHTDVVSNLIQFLCRKAAGRCQFQGAQPDLGKTPVPLHMDMWRLASFVAVKEKTIRSDNRHCRHRSIIPFSFQGMSRNLFRPADSRLRPRESGGSPCRSCRSGGYRVRA